MERIQLNAQVRKEIGKRFNKRMRREDFIPAVVYREGKKTINLKLSKKELFDTLHTRAGENVLINLKIVDDAKGKNKERTVIIKEIQHHPIKDQILHVDFQEILLTEKLTVDIPIATKGEAEGAVKQEGVLEHILWEAKVECLPTDIPEKIEVDVTHLKIGDSIFIKDIQAPPGVKILNDPEQVVVAVEPPHVEKPKEEVAEEVTEPELIREKKEKEEIEEGAEEAAPVEKKQKKATENEDPKK